MKDTSFYGKFQLNLKGKLLSFEQPLVMGILNLTPDSFYAGSRIKSHDELLTQVAIMLNEGADILDIGGYSSRPGAEDISEEEELDRVCKAIGAVHKEFPECIISIDTFRALVAEEAVSNGAHIVNDISGGQLDDKMFETVGKLNVPYILMHMKGTPQTMKELTDYDSLTGDLQLFFSKQIKRARAAGIKDIILDPGIGFSKTIAQNFELLKKLELFHLHDCPILVGISRKSMIYKTLGITADESLNGTTALNMFALTKGASILRVHDVKEASDLVSLHRSILDAG